MHTSPSARVVFAPLHVIRSWKAVVNNLKEKSGEAAYLAAPRAHARPHPCTPIHAHSRPCVPIRACSRPFAVVQVVRGRSCPFAVMRGCSRAVHGSCMVVRGRSRPFVPVCGGRHLFTSVCVARGCAHAFGSCRSIIQ